jgi:hypothetical protein
MGTSRDTAGSSGIPTVVWTVDDDLANSSSPPGLPSSAYPYTTTDVRAMVDMVLGDQIRHSRAQYRARVKDGTGVHCGSTTHACIHLEAYATCTTNADCPNPNYDVCSGGECNHCDQGVGKRNFTATGGCDSTNTKCTTCLCAGAQSTHPRSIIRTVAHEQGHSIGLNHPARQSIPGVTGTPSCADAYAHPDTGCDTSLDDGGDGEVMIHRLSCISRSPYADGDCRGIRKAHSSEARPTRIERASRFQLGSGLTALAHGDIGAPETPDNVVSIWNPRIDCAKGTVVSGGYTCAMVRTFPDPTNPTTANPWIDIIGLKSWSSAGWSGTGLVSFQTNIASEPDIAISDDGSVAFVTWVSATGETVQTWAINLSSHASSMVSLAYAGVLPPRVAFDSDFDASGSFGAVVLGVKAVRVAANLGGGYNDPLWAMNRLTYNVSTNVLSQTSLNLSTSTFDVDASKHEPFSDYDVDCQKSSGTDTCVIVATLTPEDDDSLGHHPIGSLRSFQFSVSTGNVVSFPEGFNSGGAIWEETINADKLPRPTALNAVIGVAISDSHLYVSSGRMLTSSFDTANTRVSEFSGLGVGSTFTESSSTNTGSDQVEGFAHCSTSTSADSITHGAISSYGGWSVAWCPTCGTTGGTLEGLVPLSPIDGKCW